MDNIQINTTQDNGNKGTSVNNKVTYNFLFLLVIVYPFTKYILPRFVRLFKTLIFFNPWNRIKITHHKTSLYH